MSRIWYKFRFIWYGYINEKYYGYDFTKSYLFKKILLITFIHQVVEFHIKYVF